MKSFLSIFMLMFLLGYPAAWAQDSTQVTSAVVKTDPPYRLAVGLQLTGIGFGFLNPKGFTLKHFVKENVAIEYVLTPGGRNIISSGLLVQKHFPVADADNLTWYLGAGANLDVYRYQPITNLPEPAKEKVTTTTTFLGTLGAEYFFPKAPFTLSADIKTGIWGFSGYGLANRYNNIYGLRPNLSFRYIF